MSLEFGVVPCDDLGLPHFELISAVEKALNGFSYDHLDPPDFRGLFLFLVASFEQCDDLDLLQKACDTLANIAGYKLGVSSIDVFVRVKLMALKLIASTNVAHIKSAVSYFRKVARAVGPRVVLRDFVAANIGSTEVHRGLAIISHQLITDFPEFTFGYDDFGEWVDPLGAVPGIGQRLVSAIESRRRDCIWFRSEGQIRTPTVAHKFNLGSVLMSGESTPQVPVHPQSARPGMAHRLMPRKPVSEPISSSIFQLSQRQKQVREFIDRPFSPDIRISDVMDEIRTSLSGKDWEERSASYNGLRRVLRYNCSDVSDDDLHLLITAAIDDANTPRGALFLAVMSGIEEAFRTRSRAMEFELPRILPAIMKLHQKSAQFVEESLAKCFAVIVANVPAKRFLAVLMQNSDTKSPKVQAAIAKYCKESLMRCLEEKERLFVKAGNEAGELVKLIWRLMAGSTSETREGAKEAAKAFGRIYGDTCSGIVHRVLENRDAADFLRNTYCA
jgi:hypothetical protein